MTNELEIALNWANLHKTELLALVGGAGGLSVLLESLLLKLKNKWHVDSKKLAFSLLHVLTVLTTVVTWYLGNMSDKQVLPIYGTLVIAAEFWHRFAISPSFNKVVIPFLTYLSNQKTTSTPLPQTISPEPSQPTPADQLV